MHDFCWQNPFAPQEEFAGHVPSPGTQVFWQLLNWLQACPGPQSALVLQPTTQNFTGSHRHAPLVWSSQIMVPVVEPPSRTQSVSLEQSPGPARHAPQPEDSPGV